MIPESLRLVIKAYSNSVIAIFRVPYFSGLCGRQKF
jgi:hypothetical protein